MGTTAKGLRYPEPEDRLNLTHTFIQNLADDVNGKLPVLPMFSEAAATVTVSVASGAKNGSATVTWPAGRFSQPPIVASSVGISSAGTLVGATVLLTANTATQTTVRVELAATAASATSVPVQLIARQATSAASAG